MPITLFFWKETIKRIASRSSFLSGSFLRKHVSNMNAFNAFSDSNDHKFETTDYLWLKRVVCEH